MDWNLIIIISLNIIGWFVVFKLNLRQQDKKIKDEAKMKVYNEFWSLRKHLQESSSGLMALIQSKPFILMDSTSILGSVTKNELDILKGEHQSWQDWNEYMSELNTKINLFKAIHLDFLRNIEMWIHIMPKLEVAKDILFSEQTIINEKISEHYNFLQNLNVQKWKEWDQKEINSKSAKVWEDIVNFLFYVEDMMVLIHNNLVSPIFGYKKLIRKPTDYKFKVLTEDGLIVIKDKNE